VTGRPAARDRGLVALAGIALIAGLITGRPELIVIAVPALVYVAVGLALAREPHLLHATLTLDRDRGLEDEPVRGTLTVRNDGTGGVELELRLLSTPQLVIEAPPPTVLHLGAGATAQLPVVAHPRRWGAHSLGPLAVRARDPLGVMTWSGRLGRRRAVRTFPREPYLHEVIAAATTQTVLGSHVARTHGAGIEFAEIGPFTPGDRIRQVNWRATARRGELLVDRRHPEQSGDVVLLLDTFAAAHDGQTGTLDAAVRAAAALARRHLAQRDRVALVDVGGTLQWLEPAFGSKALYRIIDALLSSEITFSYAWRTVESIPRPVLPPGALIVAISPLLDERSLRLLIDLRHRNRDLAIIEVTPLAHTAPGNRPGDATAFELWRLQREARLTQLRRLGIAVATWQESVGLAVAVEEVNAFRRSARHITRV
jgi:uncharacterized protein (DUF58 family)